MKVGQLAAAAGASVQTIHYYERRKLLPAAQRLPSGYRDYPAESVRIVQLIKRMQEFGFTLRELGHFVRLLETRAPSARQLDTVLKMPSWRAEGIRLIGLINFDSN